MRFYENFNNYIEQCGCMAKDISARTGISAATLSRYRSGERVPDMESDAFRSLCRAIAQIAADKNIADITEDSVRESFMKCSDFVSTDKEQLRQNFNTLITVLNLNMSNLCQQTNYDTSTVYRIRNGSRQPADPEQFASSISLYVAQKTERESDLAILAELIGTSTEELSDYSVRYTQIKNWMLEGHTPVSQEGGVSGFLTKLDEFDLNEYIKAIHFDEMKVPSLPFQLPTSKYYYGLNEMMESEIDFLKATVLSKSQKPVTLYSDMPMTEMAKDPEFPKKWMYGMALMLKKGLHLNNIHNLDRSFEEMMLGLESWIPMYMTGQISPYYLKSTQNGVFHHFLRVSGAAALSGEAIFGHHSDGRYYMSKTKDDIAYYTMRAENLLENAHPLMDIYREDNAGKLKAFALADLQTPGKRRGILSAPPVYTMDVGFLEQLLDSHGVTHEDKQSILKYTTSQRDLTEQLLATELMEDEIPRITKEEFELHPIALPLSGMFYEKDIRYTYEEYSEHLRQTEQFAKAYPNYTVNFTTSNPFRNLQILMHEGQWAMISKGNAPAIHFVIHHPKLRNAIENFVPPVFE